MKIGLLRAGLCLATLWTLSAAGACGGNVVVDGLSTGTGALNGLDDPVGGFFCTVRQCVRTMGQRFGTMA